MNKPKYGASDNYLAERGKAYFDKVFRDPEVMQAYLSGKFRHVIHANDTVLDFGAGSGDCLVKLTCRRKIAVEINPAAYQACQEKGLECYRELAEVPDQQVDIAISNHCLEHVPFPIEALRQICKKLKPNGRLALCVPIDDWRNHKRFRPHDHNRHLHTWTVQLLGHTLEEAGFTVNPHDIRIVNRTRPGRFTRILFHHLPMPLFNRVCQVWAIATRRRELFATVKPDSNDLTGD